MVITASVIACTCLMFPLPSQAYLDPGSGSMVLQIVLAGIFAVSFFLKLAWSSLKKWFSRSSPVEDKKQPQG